MSMDHSHPGGFHIDLPNVSIGTRLMRMEQPAPPTFTPNDRYVVAGDCTSLGHVYVFSGEQQNWRCVSCRHVAPAGRPAPTLPAGPIEVRPAQVPPLKIGPQQPGWTPDTIQPMMPTRDPLVLPQTLTREFGSPCAFDNLPPNMQGKPLGLVCFCPKCSATC